MKIETEDIIFGSLALISIAIWFFMLRLTNMPLLSIIFLWTSMILISALYIIVYNRNNRDKKILRLCSAYAETNYIIDIRLHPKERIYWYQNAYLASQELDDTKGEIFSLWNQGNAYNALGNTHQSIACHEEALALARNVGEKHGEANANASLGSANFGIGNFHKGIFIRR